MVSIRLVYNTQVIFFWTCCHFSSVNYIIHISFETSTMAIEHSDSDSECDIIDIIEEELTLAKDNASVITVTDSMIHDENGDVQCIYAPHNLTLIVNNAHYVYCEGNLHITAHTGVGHIYARGSIVVNGITVTHVYSGSDIHLNLLPGTVVVKTTDNQDDYSNSPDTLSQPRPYPAFVAGYMYSVGTQCIDLRGFAAPTVCGNLFACDLTYFTDPETPPIQFGNVFVDGDNAIETQPDETTENGSISTPIEGTEALFNKDGHFMRLLEG
jgi:hypothetical protein